MVVFEYPYKDFLALDRAVGSGELQGIVAWALSYRRFPILDLAVRTLGPEQFRVEVRLFEGAGQLAAVIPFEVGWGDLDRDARETLEFYARPDTDRDLMSRWRARGESPDDLEATRAAWDYLAFQYLSAWERDDDGSEERAGVLGSLAPERSETRGSFAPRHTGADIEVIESGQAVCLLASSAIEHAAVGQALFGVEAEAMHIITRWTVVDVDAEHELLVVREKRKRGDTHRMIGPLVAWFAPTWCRDARRLLEDAEEVADVDCLLGAGLRDPIVGGTGRVRCDGDPGRGREVELSALPPALLERAPSLAREIAAAVRAGVQRLSDAGSCEASAVADGFTADSFAPRRAARVLPRGQAEQAGPLCGYRITGAVRCHGVERLLVIEWTVQHDDPAEAAELLASGRGMVRSYLVASTHAADEIAALRSLQGAFRLDHPC
jgi:hypothetical protein